MPLIDKILIVNEHTPEKISHRIAERVKARRRELGLTQAELCERAGVTLSSFRRFEQSGLISLESLIRVAIALRQEEGFEELFTRKGYQSIEDVIRDREQNQGKG